jgi:choline dehydrogenase-like flavoprotein
LTAATGAAFEPDDDSVAVVIGSGAGGGVLAHELTARGIRVVLLEAGKHIPKEEFRNDELFAYQQLSWLEPRTASGSWAVAKFSPDLPAWSVRAVGGTSIHWGALAFRMREYEFRARTTYGEIEGAALADWPVQLAELAPFYARAEARLGVTGTNEIPLLPVTNNYKVLWNGATRMGYRRVANDRHAINSLPRDGRSSCLQLGFCSQGCKSGAKWATLYAEIPRALATGKLELRAECTALRIEHDSKGRASAVVYADASGAEQRQKARFICVAASAVETPRLLLNSTSSRFPQGLANSSGLVGAHFMKHVTASVFGLFAEPVHMNRGVTMCGTVYDEDRFDAQRGFAGGYLMQGVNMGLPFLAAVSKPGAWGRDFTRYLEKYAHLAGVWLNGEDLPREINRVRLHAERKDRFGMPIADIHVDEHTNDVAIRQHFYAQAAQLMRAAGATDVMQGSTLPASHLMGTCRMSKNPARGVLNSFGRTHDVPNLFVSDGSSFVTSSAENPTLTIVALALRQAGEIERLMGAREI